MANKKAECVGWAEEFRLDCWAATSSSGSRPNALVLAICPDVWQHSGIRIQDPCVGADVTMRSISADETVCAGITPSESSGQITHANNNDAPNMRLTSISEPCHNLAVVVEACGHLDRLRFVRFEPLGPELEELRDPD